MQRQQYPLEAEALDFIPAIINIQEKPPSPLPRAVLYSLVSLFAILLIWASIGRVDVIALAEGKLVPQTYLKIVQPAEAGIIQAILVKEGEAVVAGQVLMRMDTTFSQADTQTLATELKLKALQLRRIDAELNEIPLVRQNDDPAELFSQVEAQYAAHRQAYQDALAQEQAALAKAQQDLAAAEEIQSKLRQVVPVYQSQEQAFAKLGREGFAGNLMVLEKQRERIEKEQDLRTQNYTVASLKAAITQAEKRLAQITSNYRQQLHNERVEAETQYQKLKQDWVKQAHRSHLLELKAPQAGIIKDIATHTAGAVISPGTIVMTLVPDDEPLQAEVMVKNEDVGFVYENQRAKIKLAAYPFQKYGMIEGVVTHVSADATEQALDRQESTEALDRPAVRSPYKALITLQAQALEVEGDRFTLAPGMQVIAEIHQGERTVLEYLLSPVQKAFHEAGRER
jgi:HlyD family secretion protein